MLGGQGVSGRRLTEAGNTIREWEMENAKVDADTRKNRIKHDEDGQEQMYAMSRGVATKRGLTLVELDASPSEFENHLQAKAKEWYLSGLAEADKLTGE
ncbi:hypothetical protein AB0K62_03465 [Streptomyces halstedii]|uniref:hypothetical protein n=1 Tax=Streptomyces halstedii TaxID=1944 RepID=UPI00345FCEC3|nr:hypothetical protein OG291_23000 [Streptomyces halstedii]